jgi:hypothetical protein
VECLDGVLYEGRVVDARGDDAVEPGKLVSEVGRHGGIHRRVPDRLLVCRQRRNVGDAVVGTFDDDGAPIRPGDGGWTKDAVSGVQIRL